MEDVRWPDHVIALESTAYKGFLKLQARVQAERIRLQARLRIPRPGRGRLLERAGCRARVEPDAIDGAEDCQQNAHQTSAWYSYRATGWTGGTAHL